MSRWDALRSDRRKTAVGRRRWTVNEDAPSFPRRSKWRELQDKLRSQTHDGDMEVVLQDISSIFVGPIEIRRDDPVGDVLLELLDKIPLAKFLHVFSRICRTDNFQLNKSELSRIMNVLTRQASDDVSSIQALCHVAIKFAKDLPAEHTATAVLDSTLIPAISSAPVQISSLVLEAIGELVAQTHHTSAILSPLTLEISSDGEERTVENPIGQRLVDALERSLPRSCPCYPRLSREASVVCTETGMCRWTCRRT